MKKMSKCFKLTLISSTIAVILVLAIIFLYFSVPISLPISKLGELDVPYVDLKRLETSMRLEIPTDELTKSLNYILFKKSPWAAINTCQTYSGYSLNSQELIDPYVSLSTTYYQVSFPQTTERICQKDKKIGSLEYWKYLKTTFTDLRFDQCFVLEDFTMEYYPKQDENGYDKKTRNHIKILVIKNRHIFYLEYVGGELTKEVFLNELARIL
jgi:hypothetical protein